VIVEYEQCVDCSYFICEVSRYADELHKEKNRLLEAVFSLAIEQLKT
jgi:Fe-S-cluster formation regulator IscX/YfhJ